jgi:hypothetical protein
MMGCLVILGLLLVGAAAGGIYVWRRASYTPPVRTAPDIPQRAAGTLTEFPVDNDPNAPARPTSVHTEALTGATAKAEGYTPIKLPPGIDRPSLSKGATAMTSATYKPKPKSAPASTVPSTKDEIYISVLVATNQAGFTEGLAESVLAATGGQQTGVRVQSPKGPIYTGSSVRSPQGTVYVLNKQGGEIVILIYAPDPSMQSVVDRLAQNVNNGEGLNDYPEIKNAFWTLPAQTPSDLTLVEISTLTSAQIENSMGSSLDTRGAPRPSGSWASLGTADCTGQDVGQSVGSASPDPAQCNTNGTIAICWDGVSYKNPGKAGAWCTYKNTGGKPCRGGGNPGFVYQCSVAGASSIATRPTPDTGERGTDLPPAMRAFIPDRMTTARYLDSSRQEWVAINLEYGSSFQAWRTWLLARGALGLGGAESTTVREVDGLYLTQEGKRLLVFQKGPYLIFLSGPAAASQERLVALGNQFQV